MHRRLTLLSALVIASAGISLPGPAAQAAAGAPPPVTEQAADTRSEQNQVANYWTEAKMEDAVPLDTPTPRTSVKLGTVLEPTTGVPWRTPPTVPQSTPAARVGSPGLVWNLDGGIAQTTGRVFFTTGGRNASCSGSAVTSANKSVVITAGHCVKMDGAYHTNWAFVPGYDRGARPYGTWVASKLLTTPQWDASEEINFDVAAAVVAPLQGKSLTDAVGGQGIAFNQTRRQQVYSFGYPAAAPYDGSKLVYCSGRAFDDYLTSRDHGLTCNMTGGSSGGPWFTSFNEATGLGTQTSVNSFKYNFAPNWMFGPYFGAEAQAVYNAAQGANAL